MASTTYEILNHRDPYGQFAKLTKRNQRKTGIYHAWEPQDRVQDENPLSERTRSAPEYSRERRLSMVQDQMDHSIAIHMPYGSGSDNPSFVPGHQQPDPSKRRTLPKPPSITNPTHDAIKSEGQVPMSSAQAIHRDPAELMEEQDAKFRGSYGRTIQPLGPGPEWRGKDPKMSGLSIAERPPWVGVTGEANAVFGDYIAPVLGRKERHDQQQQQFADRHFLQSLRIPEDPNVQWRTDKVRRKTMLESDMDADADLPDVFVRLLDHTRYPGAHRARFSADGVGMGIEGRREDTLHQEVIAGNGTITRNLEPEMDAPHKPIMPWDEDRMQPHAFYTQNINPEFSTADANEDQEMTHGVIGRLASELHKTHTRDGGDYETTQKTRQHWKTDDHHVRSWQK